MPFAKGAMLQRRFVIVPSASCQPVINRQATRSLWLIFTFAGSGNALSVSLNGPKLGVHLGMAALTILKGGHRALQYMSRETDDVRAAVRTSDVP